MIKVERQSIRDLELRIIAIRSAIARCNAETSLTVGATTRSIADWLVWRREVAPDLRSFLHNMSQKIHSTRQDAARKMLSVVTSGDVATRPTDIFIHIDELELAAEIDELETIEGDLDGLLSLKNATTFIEV